MTNVMFLTWNRSIPGRERVSAAEGRASRSTIRGLQQGAGAR